LRLEANERVANLSTNLLQSLPRVAHATHSVRSGMSEHATDQHLGEVVYVLGTPGSNIVKIGRTTNLHKRFADIQRMSPVPLLILWTHPGGSELETNLHRHFKAIRSHGEWFNFEGDPVNQIRNAVSSRPWIVIRPARVTATRTVIDLQPKRLTLPRAHDFTGIESAITARFGELRAIPDPVERFIAVRTERSELAAWDRKVMQQEADAVRGLHASGLSWRAVGQLLNITGSRAEQIAKRP
jgi:T5orf172 domain.